MNVWILCFWNTYTWKNEYQTFDLVEDLQEFLEDYIVKVKKKFPCNTLEDSCIIFNTKTKVLASDIMNGKYNNIIQ